MAAHQVTDSIDRELRAAGTPERAEQEKRYLKSELEHYGVRVPIMRKIVQGARSGFDDVRPAELMLLAEDLWGRGVYEVRAAAVEMLVMRASELEPEHIDFIGRLIREARTWALVDPLATSVVGTMREAHPVLSETMSEWARDEDFWIRRAALLSFLAPLRRGEGDWDGFTRMADAMLSEKEFFIRKAIGWVLRDTSRKRPALVYEWILPRAGRASGVTVREAVRRLSDEQRKGVMDAYRSPRT